MPKFKRASSSLLSFQAKKHKKKQREDPVKWQQGRERDRLRYQAYSSPCVLPRSEETDSSRRLQDTTARRQVRQNNLERRLLEQERDTATHRWACLNPDRRAEEQQRNTAAHRQSRVKNTERRQLEQVRDTATHQRVRSDNPLRRTNEQVRNTAAHQVSRENPDVRRAE